MLGLRAIGLKWKIEFDPVFSTFLKFWGCGELRFLYSGFPLSHLFTIIKCTKEGGD